ncbi:MAG TPA: LacI family transcriptional regulator [Clostridiales bacterium]|nr:LacI family transcriptional regulator [Clostridiales bacterium]
MKRIRIIALFLVVFLAALPLSSCAGSGADTPKIAVIAKATTSDFWHAVRAGVEAAAIEYNASVTFEGPENEEDYEAQNRMIADAVERGVDVIVLSAIDYNQNAAAVKLAVQHGTKVITIDSNVNSDLVSQFIGTDNYEAGIAAAKAAVASPTRDGAKIRIGLVNYMSDTANGQKREEGFRDHIASVGDAEIVASVTAESNAESATAGAKELLLAHPEINVLVGFNEWMTLGVGNAIHELGKGELVAGIGFDSNVISVGMLESGEMDALIVQNPFAIGYLGVRNAARLAVGDSVGDARISTAMTTVTKENMFDSDIQKILFRFT